MWLRYTYREYSALFGSGPETVELLNALAPTFFDVVQQSLAQEMILAICRLLDPAESGKYENLSMHQLLAALRDDGSANALVADIQHRCDELEAQSQPLRAKRDQLFAHMDLPHFAGRPDARPLDPTSIELLGSAISKLQDVIDTTGRFFHEDATSWDELQPRGGAADLLVHLRNARGVRDQETRDRIQSG